MENINKEKFINFLNELENDVNENMENQDLYDNGRIENQGVLDTIDLINIWIKNNS